MKLMLLKMVVGDVVLFKTNVSNIYIISLVYMPVSEMNTVEKLIYELVGTSSTTKPGGWLYRTLPHILNTISQAYTRITEKGRA